MCNPTPYQQVAALSFSNSTSTFFAIGEPESGPESFYDFSDTLTTPLFLPTEGTYWLDFADAQLLIGDDFVFFPTDTLNYPGAALAVIGDSPAPAPVPEPATLLLLGIGLGAGAVRRRFKPAA